MALSNSRSSCRWSSHSADVAPDRPDGSLHPFPRGAKWVVAPMRADTTKADDPFVTEAARPSSMRLLHLGREREVAELEASAVAHRINRKDPAMPLVNVKVMEDVLTDQQKAHIADPITVTFSTVVGEPVGPVARAVIADTRSGQLSLG